MAEDPWVRLKRLLDTTYGRGPRLRLFRAPGRVNLIGEHTDYNGGFVLPCALEMDFRVAIRPNTERGLCRIIAADLADRDSFRVRSPRRSERRQWVNYVRGVVWALADAGYRFGSFDAALSSDVPQGSGLSSSAAMEVAVGYAIAQTFGLDIDLKTLAVLCRRAENEFVGVPCGIMDQYIACLARRDCALFLDCRTLEHEHVPLFGEEFRLVVLDTAKQRTLAASKYEERLSECQRAAQAIAQRYPEVRELRDVTPEMLAAMEGELEDVLLRRTRHVVSENSRVLRAREVLAAGDMRAFGELLNASHESLRADYEVSCAELDAIVDIARGVDGVLGARMTGAGFGGCAIAIVRAEQVGELERAVREQYPARTGLSPRVYVSRAAPGASEVSLA